MTTEEFHAYQEKSFDAFCRAVIRNESIDAHRELATQAKREVAISTLTPETLLALSTEDTYLPYRKTFYVGQHAVHVCDEDLGEVLQYIIPPAQRCPSSALLLGLQRFQNCSTVTHSPCYRQLS